MSSTAEALDGAAEIMEILCLFRRACNGGSLQLDDPRRQFVNAPRDRGVAGADQLCVSSPSLGASRAGLEEVDAPDEPPTIAVLHLLEVA